MTVESTVNKSGPYAGAGSPGPFTVGFRFIDQAHLRVIKTSTTGVNSDLTLTTDYSVAGVGDPTGSVTLVVALAVGEKLTIVRDVPVTQEADYVQNDAFPAQSHEDALDKLTMIAQQHDERLESALTLPPTVTGANTELPVPQANYLIGWDEAATGLQNVNPALLATIVSYGTARSDLFDGDGVTTQFVLTDSPGALANIDAAVSGVTQRASIDFNWTSGEIVTFTTPPPAGTNNVHIRYLQALPQGASDSASASFIQAGAGAVERNVQDRLRDTVSVKDFPANGTGLSDDWAGIQAAIDAVSSAGGGTVEFPRGVYLSYYPIHLKNNVTLDLRSGATIRRMFNSATPPGYGHAHAGLIATDTGFENVSILGGTLDGNGGVFDTSFVIMGGVGWENVHIEGTRFLDVVDFHALDIANADGVTVRDCKFLGFYNKAGTRQFSEAIQLDPNISGGGSDNKNVLVEGCYFGDNPDQPSVNFTAWATGVGNHSAVATKYSRRITIAHNVFDGCTYAGVHPINWVDFDISNNRFVGCNNTVLLTLNTDVSPAEGCENGVIDANTFNETSATCVLWASPATPANISTGRHKNISVTNNVAVCSSTGATTGGLAAPNWTDGLVIHNNRVRNMDFGVNLRFCTSFSIVGNNIDTTDANGVLVNESTEVAYIGTGLTAHGFIANNLMRRLGFRGIHINCAANDMFVIGNKITDPDTLAAGRAGIQVDTGGTRHEVFDNSVTTTGVATFAHGIVVQSVSVLTMKGNRSTGTTNGISCAVTAAIVDMEGNGTPEAVVTAGAGSRYWRLNGGAVTTLYVKETGTGNTGWVAK